jgi:baculoviral IAP repeat-containing protein 6
VDPAHPAEWLVDTRGNNGLIVGPKGSHIKNIENVTKASVDAERDGTTVIVRGAVPDVIRAREMIEDALTRNGIDFRGKPGRGFPREDRENPEGRAAGGAETRGGGPGGDLRGLLKRKSLDADAAAAPPKAKKGPAAAANRADEPTEWMQAELEKMKARATRFGLPPPTMDDVRAKNPHKVSDKKVSDTGAVDKGFVDDDETVVVPVADKHTMSRVIGKKRSVLSMMCKVADCSMIVGNKEMAVRVRCPDAVRRAHAVALLDAVIGDEIAGARITFHGLQAAFAAIQSGAPTPKADPSSDEAAAKGKGKGGVMSRLQGDDQDDDEDEDQDEDADDADEERPKKRQAASFKFHRTVDPRGFLGAVIGKNGGTIKKLEKVTKTKMDVDQEAKTVEVKSDSARQTARGCELIESIIVSCERTKSERAAGKKTEKFVLGDILQSAIARWKNGDGDGDEKSAPEPGMNDAVEGSPEDTAAAEAGETPAEEPEGTEAEAPEPSRRQSPRRRVSPGSPRRRSRRRMRRRRHPRRRMTRPRPSRRRRRSLNPRRRVDAAAGAVDEAPRRAEARRSEFFLLLLLQERLNQSSAFAYPRVPTALSPLRICILIYPHLSSFILTLETRH